jgi:hypothetical protein
MSEPCPEGRYDYEACFTPFRYCPVKGCGRTEVSRVRVQSGPCAVADCEREASKTVLVEGIEGRALDGPLPVRVCLPCFAYYGLVEAPLTGGSEPETIKPATAKGDPRTVEDGEEQTLGGEKRA